MLCILAADVISSIANHGQKQCKEDYELKTDELSLIESTTDEEDSEPAASKATVDFTTDGTYRYTRICRGCFISGCDHAAFKMTSSGPSRKKAYGIAVQVVWQRLGRELSYSPIGFPTFQRSGNLSGNQYLSLLIKASMPKASTYYYVPETVKCQTFLYRIQKYPFE